MTYFTIAKDEFDWIVLSTETKARSFALVPIGYCLAFSSREAAAEQAQHLSGREIETKMIETPFRFEAVADTVYGP
jgi:hypothetical protein